VSEEVEAAMSKERIKNTKGRVIEFTWEGRTEEDALVFGKALYMRIQEPVRIVINSENRTVYVGRGYVESLLIYRSLNESRVLERAVQTEI
jgi:hypothetical protein